MKHNNIKIDMNEVYIPYTTKRKPYAQDKGCCLQKNDVAVMVLCDGAGSCRLSHYGAEGMSRYIAEKFMSKWHRYRDMFSDDIKRNIYLDMVEEIVDLPVIYRKEFGDTEENKDITYEDFGSTLMAVITDGINGMGIHLGDGAILRSNEDGARIMSYPMNGTRPGTTYLTSHVTAIDHFRFFRFRCKEDDNIALVTDGVELHQEKQIKQICGCMNKTELELAVRANLLPDDASAIKMTIRRQEADSTALTQQNNAEENRWKDRERLQKALMKK